MDDDFEFKSITRDLIRSRAEHNESIIQSLEELSLHQQDLVKIENLDKWCKNIQILYLQSNYISKIENLSRLKSLHYLNLAMNNVEIIENLESCENLQKLDLTMNFVRVLSNLKTQFENSSKLTELYLTGNPCTNFQNYREYCISSLPYLTRLDGTEITRTERIKAVQKHAENHSQILKDEEKALANREQQKLDYQKKLKQRLANSDPDAFWNEKEEFTPESRLETAKELAKKRKEKDQPSNSKFHEPKPQKREVRLFDSDGDPINCNEAKIDFHMEDDSCYQYLTVYTYKHLDTELIKVDLKPTHIKIDINGKVLQLVFFDEVVVEQSKSQRSQVTGYLTVTMRKVNAIDSKIETINTPTDKVRAKKPKKRNDSFDDDLPPLI